MVPRTQAGTQLLPRPAAGRGYLQPSWPLIFLCSGHPKT